MCFTTTSQPPIAPIAGGALDSRPIELVARDGTHLKAFRARAADPTGAGIVVLPDVRGLYPFYEELALRFAEAGVDAVAIDYFGRTAGTGDRDEQFEYMPHVARTTWAGLSADIRAAVDHLRPADGGAVRAIFTIGFCFGGPDCVQIRRRSGSGSPGRRVLRHPAGPGRNDVPAPIDLVDRMECPVLGLFGGADQAIPPRRSPPSRRPSAEPGSSTGSSSTRARRTRSSIAPSRSTRPRPPMPGARSCHSSGRTRPPAEPAAAYRTLGGS